MTKIEGYALTLPDQWQSWRQGEGEARAEEIAAALADGPEAQARAREAVLLFDAAPRSGLIVEQGVWAPDRASGEVVVSVSVELLVAEPGRPRATPEEFLRSAERRPRTRGVKVFHYEALLGECPAGPTVLVTHTIRGRGQPLVISAEWTVFPPGTDEAIEIAFTTPMSSVAEALSEQIAVIVASLDVVVAQG